jgi:hypothetical protein
MLTEEVKHIIGDAFKSGLKNAIKHYVSTLGLDYFITVETGSIALLDDLGQIERLFNGESDYDVLVIYDDDERNKLTNVFPQNVVEDRSVDLLFDNIKYGAGRNYISIDFLGKGKLKEVTSLSPLFFRGYRKYSARESKGAKGEFSIYHYYNDISLDCDICPIEEYRCGNNIFVKAEMNPLRNGKLCLSYLHSVVLFSKLIYESNEGAYDKIILDYRKRVSAHLKKSFSEEDFLNFFQYYRNKICDSSSLRAFDRRMIDLFEYQDMVMTY